NGPSSSSALFCDSPSQDTSISHHLMHHTPTTVSQAQVSPSLLLLGTSLPRQSSSDDHLSHAVRQPSSAPSISAVAASSSSSSSSASPRSAHTMENASNLPSSPSSSIALLQQQLLMASSSLSPSSAPPSPLNDQAIKQTSIISINAGQKGPQALPPEVWANVAQYLHAMGTATAQQSLFSLCLLRLDISAAVIEWLWRAPVVDGFRQTERFLKGIHLNIEIVKKLAAEDVDFCHVTDVLTYFTRNPDGWLERLLPYAKNILYPPQAFWTEMLLDMDADAIEKVLGDGFLRKASLSSLALSVPNTLSSNDSIVGNANSRIACTDLFEPRKILILSNYLEKRAEAEAAAAASAARELEARSRATSEMTSFLTHHCRVDQGDWLPVVILHLLEVAKLGVASLTLGLHHTSEENGIPTPFQSSTSSYSTWPTRSPSSASSSSSSSSYSRRTRGKEEDPVLAESTTPERILNCLLPTDKKLGGLFAHFTDLKRLVFYERCVTAAADAVLRVAVLNCGMQLRQIALMGSAFTKSPEGTSGGSNGGGIRFTRLSFQSIWWGCPNLEELRVERVDLSSGREAGGGQGGSVGSGGMDWCSGSRSSPLARPLIHVRPKLRDPEAALLAELLPLVPNLESLDLGNLTLSHPTQSWRTLWQTCLELSVFSKLPQSLKHLRVSCMWCRQAQATLALPGSTGASNPTLSSVPSYKLSGATGVVTVDLSHGQQQYVARSVAPSSYHPSPPSHATAAPGSPKVTPRPLLHHGSLLGLDPSPTLSSLRRLHRHPHWVQHMRQLYLPPLLARLLLPLHQSFLSRLLLTLVLFSIFAPLTSVLLRSSLTPLCTPSLHLDSLLLFVEDSLMLQTLIVVPNDPVGANNIAASTVSSPHGSMHQLAGSTSSPSKCIENLVQLRNFLPPVFANGTATLAAVAAVAAALAQNKNGMTASPFNSPPSLSPLRTAPVSASASAMKVRALLGRLRRRGCRVWEPLEFMAACVGSAGSAGSPLGACAGEQRLGMRSRWRLGLLSGDGGLDEDGDGDGPQRRS
ncbi:hypothetical protein BC829DRAFT_378849, partial [Chytridium lagenaria]